MCSCVAISVALRQMSRARRASPDTAATYEEGRKEGRKEGEGGEGREGGERGTEKILNGFQE